jgi:hypothetical protein
MGRSDSVVRLGVGIIVALTVWGGPMVASGQAESGGPGVTIAPTVGQRTFGTESEVAHVISAWDFALTLDTVMTNSYVLDGFHRYCFSGYCPLAAGVRLPAGALPSRVELDGCNDHPTNPLAFTMIRTVAGGGPALSDANRLTPLVSVGPQGCGKFVATVTTPTTIDNATYNYLVMVTMISSNSDMRFAAVRVFYTLQVSPAPASATFGDVPTSHPFFRHVEALVKSGITAGCGGGNYCPDAPLTRGQMAVFLSKALGLHFAP